MENVKISQHFPVLRTQNKLKCLRLNTVLYYDTTEKSHRGQGTRSLTGQCVNTVK